LPTLRGHFELSQSLGMHFLRIGPLKQTVLKHSVNLALLC